MIVEAAVTEKRRFLRDFSIGITMGLSFFTLIFGYSWLLDENLGPVPAIAHTLPLLSQLLIVAPFVVIGCFVAGTMWAFGRVLGDTPSPAPFPFLDRESGGPHQEKD